MTGVAWSSDERSDVPRTRPRPAYGAVFCACRSYRFRLLRRVSDEVTTILFIGLNPSTADEVKDDPTIRRCIGFAKRWGYGTLLMGNVSGFRTTDPRHLPSVDAMADVNRRHLMAMQSAAHLVVAAWGAQKKLPLGAMETIDLIRGWPEVWCLGKTQNGSPRHPLYLANSTQLERWPQ